MKKLLTLFFALTCATSIFAHDCVVDGIYYNLNKETKTATVTYKGKEYDKYTDRYVGSVYVPSIISVLGTYYYVIAIGRDAFHNCNKLTRVVAIGDGHITTIEKSAFYNCTSLSKIELPKSLTTIEEWAFDYCRSLTSVTIPYSVTKIETGAFHCCNGLTSIEIPNSVTKIGDYAFSGCTSLTSVTIPNSVTTIGKNAFKECSKLITTNYTGTIADWCKINFANGFSNPMFYSHNLFINNVEIIDLVIPNSVTKIGNYAFFGSKKLTSVVIPNSVTTIGNEAFECCDNLTSVIMGNSVREIKESAFGHCYNLASVTFSNSITTIGFSAFLYCFKLKSVTIPNSVKTIGGQAFAGCNSLTSVVIHGSVTSIGEQAFDGCDSLTSVIIPGSVKSIGEDAFSDCYIQDLYCPKDFSSLNTKHGASVITHIHRLEPNEFIWYGPFEDYAQQYVESHINKWQKRGEYEKTADWQKRVNETTRKQKIDEYLQEAKRVFLSKYRENHNYYFTLDSYDPDNEVYLIKEPRLGKFLVSVPISDAKYVRDNWSSLKINPQYTFVGNEVILKYIGFNFPNNKTYTYKPSQNLTYAKADIQYNFDPIELNLGSNTSSPQPKGQQTIQQTQLTIGKSAVDTNIPTTNKSCPNTFALIISNENYTQLKEVPCAINDGKVFAQYCEKTIGLPKDNIKLYTNATYGIMIEAIRKMKNIAKAYNGDINIIFYYSGHGAPADDTKEAYLLPVDAFGVAPEVCYSLNKLYKELADMKVKSVTMFLDACFSGATKDGDMLASVRGVAIKAKANAPIGNMVVFSAASDDQTSLPYLDMGHGLFTYFLLKKLQDSKGDVTYQELGDYVKQEVYRRSSVVGKVQTPTISAGTTTENWQNWKLE